jgi:hypothetical protein
MTRKNVTTNIRIIDKPPDKRYQIAVIVGYKDLRRNKATQIEINHFIPPEECFDIRREEKE